MWCISFRTVVYTASVIRKQIYLEEALSRRLRRAAAARRRSASSLIREAVVRYLDAEPSSDDPIRGFIGGSEGGPKDASVEHDRYLYGSDR